MRWWRIDPNLNLALNVCSGPDGGAHQKGTVGIGKSETVCADGVEVNFPVVFGKLQLSAPAQRKGRKLKRNRENKRKQRKNTIFKK